MIKHIMHSCRQLLPFILILSFSFSFSFPIGCSHNSNDNETMNNKKIIRQAFEKWSAGEGNFFDLLTDNVIWTITGNSPVSKTYFSRQQFLDEVIQPLNKKFSKKIVPKLRGLYADGDMVIALWDGTATATDGRPYVNTYSWYMKMKKWKIIEVIAFFDTIEFTGLWERVKN